MVQVGLLFVRLNIKHCPLALRVLTKAGQTPQPPETPSLGFDNRLNQEMSNFSAAGLRRHSAWPAPSSAPAGFLCRPLIENCAAGQPVNFFNPFLPSPPPLGQALQGRGADPRRGEVDQKAHWSPGRCWQVGPGSGPPPPPPAATHRPPPLPFLQGRKITSNG